MGDSNYVLSELAGIESRLKNWFLFRRVQAERSLAIKRLLDDSNFIGLECNNDKLPMVDRILWNDLVNGKPELEDSLSLDAKELKADVYMDIFTRGCNLDNRCRLPGSVYLRCLADNYKLHSAKRSVKCEPSFQNFNACRKDLKQQQIAAVAEATKRQDKHDEEAKELFDRRKTLLAQLEERKTCRM